MVNAFRKVSAPEQITSEDDVLAAFENFAPLKELAKHMPSLPENPVSVIREVNQKRKEYPTGYP